MEAKRWQKLRHTLITHRSFSEGGPCTVIRQLAGARMLRRVTLTNYTAGPLWASH